MQTILNYKAYYDVFRLGVVDDGYTAVAKILFFPLFNPATLLDGAGTPYGVTNQNASAWAKGKEPIPKTIRKAVTENQWTDSIVNYFKQVVYPKKLSSLTQNDMLAEMADLIQNSNLTGTKKKKLLKLYENKQYGEFLAFTFQMALLGKNNISPDKTPVAASDQNSPSLNEFRELIQEKYIKPRTVVPTEIQPEEMGYVKELYAAYADASGEEVNSPDDLIRIRFKSHFERQRKSYYLAETIHRKVRDSIPPNEEDCFDVLKDEIEQGIDVVSHMHYQNGVDKVNAVTDKAASVQISRYAQTITFDWIGPGEKKGVCHMLVGDERLKWVGDDEE